MPRTPSTFMRSMMWPLSESLRATRAARRASSRVCRAPPTVAPPRRATRRRAPAPGLGRPGPCRAAHDSAPATGARAAQTARARACAYQRLAGAVCVEGGEGSRQEEAPRAGHSRTRRRGGLPQRRTSRVRFKFKLPAQSHMFRTSHVHLQNICSTVQATPRRRGGRQLCSPVVRT